MICIWMRRAASPAFGMIVPWRGVRARYGRRGRSGRRNPAATTVVVSSSAIIAGPAMRRPAASSVAPIDRHVRELARIAIEQAGGAGRAPAAPRPPASAAARRRFAPTVTDQLRISTSTPGTARPKISAYRSSNRRRRTARVAFGAEIAPAARPRSRGPGRRSASRHARAVDRRCPARPATTIGVASACISASRRFTARRCRIAERLIAAAHDLVGDRRAQEADRRAHAGAGRDDDPLHAELLGEPRGMQRRGAAERDQRAVARASCRARSHARARRWPCSRRPSR